jgi:predicted RNA-binding protein with PIN domain
MLNTGYSYLLVDGYNIIHASQVLADMAADSLEASRRKLCDTLSEFMGMTTYIIIAVFDAHMVEGGLGSVTMHHNIWVVFTREAETADHYIERAAKKLAIHDKVTVATSDYLEQIIIIGQGARRISAPDLWAEIEQAREDMRERFIRNRPIKNNPIAGLLDAETARKLDEMRYM